MLWNVAFIHFVRLEEYAICSKTMMVRKISSGIEVTLGYFVGNPDKDTDSWDVQQGWRINSHG